MLKRIVYPLTIISALSLASCSGPDAKTEEPIENVTVEGENTIAEPAAVETIDAGLAVGAKAPLDAKLKMGDTETTLGEVVKEGPAVFIFTRSVDWCPFCQTQLKGVNAIVGDLKERGYALYGVSYDSVESQDRFIKNQMLDYKMLSDEGSATIDAFGLRDPQYTDGKAKGVPYASVIVIGTDGTITAKSVSGDYKKRPTNDQVLAIIDAI